MNPMLPRLILFATLTVTSFAAASSAAAQLGPGPGGPGPAALPPLAPPPVPPGNPLTPAKVNLGRALFWDEQVSSTRSVACGTCHVPAAGGSDARSALDLPFTTHPGPDGIFGNPDDVTGSAGVPRNLADGVYVFAPDFGLRPQVTSRKAPSVINAAYFPTLFWDGRAGPQFAAPVGGQVLLPFGGALEDQVLEPPVSAVEMAYVGREWPAVALRVANSPPLVLSPEVPPALAQWIAGRSYPELFAEAFGTPQVTPARIALAIASYERTLFSDQTPFDALLAGAPGALTPLELQGRQLFASLNCNQCHTGALLSDRDFHFIGVRPPAEDVGRFAVTGDPADLGAFKTPSLRNVELRAPYFHDGSKGSLMAVVEFYDRGGDFDAPHKDPLIQPLGLTDAEKLALVAFLRRPLTDPRVPAEAPPFDRPRLASESDRVPQPFGFPSPGSLGVPPRAIAVEPTWGVSPNFTLGLDRLPGQAPAFLAVDLSPAPPGGTPLGGATFWLGGSHDLLVHAMAVDDAGGPLGGFASLPVNLAQHPVAAGTEVFVQWLVLDSSAPDVRLSASRGLTLTFF